MIPEDKLTKFKKLRPGRKMIVQQYYLVKESETRSHKYIIRRVAFDLGYAIDANGWNTHVSNVVKEFSK